MKHKTIIPFLIAITLITFFAPQQLKAQQLDQLCDFDSYEHTLFCAYSIYEEESFNLGLDEQGAVMVSSLCDDADIKDFIFLKTKEFRDYKLLPKLELGDLCESWRKVLPEEIVAALVKHENAKANAQNSLCANSDPFCTDNGLYDFPAGVDAGIGEQGPYYACLGTRPNPAWYYMRILDPGDMDIYMYSTPSVDIDFCCWGPFDNPTEPCPSGLTRQKVVSCSYSTNWNETCQIRGAQEGEYYILLITNYSNRTCDIHFSKTSGDATTDCNILPPLVSYEDPACMGGDLHFYANGSLGDAFRWFQMGSNWTSNEQNPIRPNATLDMSGTYGCVISRDGQFSDTTYIEVVVNESIIYQRVVDTCNSFSWLGVEYTESGHYEEHLTTAAGCDSIIDLTLTLGYTPEFEIVGNHWPIGGSETYISVNEYAIALDNPLAHIDTVLWSVDCENWRFVPHGRGETCTLYIYTFLETPVELHATAINACGSIEQNFSIQTSYFEIGENVGNESVSILPNPTNGAFSLHLEGWQNKVKVEIFDSQGRPVLIQNCEVEKSLTFNLKDYRKGLYFLRVTDSNRCVTSKLIIQ
jgi:hypothetical protein